MKRWFAVLCAALMAVSLALFAACSGKTETPGGSDDGTGGGNNPPAEQGTVTGVTFNCDDILFAGETVALRATVATEGTVSDKSVTWSVTGDAAEIDAEGNLTLLKEGETTVTATSKADPSKSASKDVEILQGGAPLNGTFDRAGDLMWGIYPDEPDNYEKTADVARDGKYALKVTTTADYTILFHAVTIGDGYAEMEPGGYYVIEGYALSQAENGGTVKPRANFQNVISASEKPTLGAVVAIELGKSGEWVRFCSSTVCVPEDAAAFNACVELYGKGEIYLDSIRVVEVESNDTRLSELKVDGAAVSGYSDTTNSYTVAVDDVSAAKVTAVAVNSTTDVDIAYAEGGATVTLTAEDGTVRTITLSFVKKQPTALTSLSVGGTPIAEFSSLRTEYYVQLASGTAQIPEITYEKAEADSTVEVKKPDALPGYVTLTVAGGGQTQDYKIYFEAADPNQLTMKYWDTGFEQNATGWGTDGAEATTAVSHSGAASLKAGANGKGAWLGFDFAGGTDAPSKGEAIKAGVWVFIEENAELSGYILIEFREKENDILAATVQRTVTAEDDGKWIYVETPASSAITDAAAYGQIVVKNFTNSVAYFDDVRVIRTEAAVTPEPCEPGEVDLSVFDPGFEGTEIKFESWATGSTYTFDTTIFHEGKQSLKVEAAAYDGFKFVLTVGKDVQVGDVLTYTAWIYEVSADDMTKDAMIKIETEDGYKAHQFVGGTTGQWVQLTVKYTVTDQDEQILLIVGCESAVVYYVDDIQLSVNV